MITNALRSLWAEPRAAAVPERLSRDWVLVGVLMVTALLEGVFRDDVAWRPFATIVAVGLAPVLLWRRTHPLACVVVAFGTGLALGLVSLAGGVQTLGLNTMVYNDEVVQPAEIGGFDALDKVTVADKELLMATQLIESLTRSKWSATYWTSRSMTCGSTPLLGTTRTFESAMS